MATVPLVTLLDALLQKAYNDLNILQELLRNKSDGDRKMEIVKYAQRTRALLIRLLALVKWAGNSSSVQKCSEMSAMLSQQSGLYVDTADQLVHLVRTMLVNACAPNFSLAPALDVLSTGAYPRLPTCIKDRIIPLPPLEDKDRSQAFSLINGAIRCRLLRETIPDNMKVTSIGDGVICFKVAYEFELVLSVLSDDPSTAWRLISLKVLVGEALPDRPVLLHAHQKLYLHQLVQSRLYSEEKPLRDCYSVLHSFCLALQLDCLHSQANQLSSEVYGGYMKIEEYAHAHHLKIVYWRPGSLQFMRTFLLDQSQATWPKILISMDPSQASCPFTTQHFPPLPGGMEVSISASDLSLESLLKECVQVRSHTLLKGIKEVLKGSPWDDKAELRKVPLCLRIRVPLKYGVREVVLGVDPRVGNIVASVDPPFSGGKVPFSGGKVQACLEALEKAVMSSWSNLSSQLSKLQSHLFLAQVSEISKELNLPVHWNLPLVNPLPFHSLPHLYVELHPQTYLVVSITEGLVDQYHLLNAMPSSLGSPPTIQTSPLAPPRIFAATSSLTELDVESIALQHLKLIEVKRSGAPLKRKMKESSLALPSLKRMCFHGDPEFSPLPSLIKARMLLLSMETSLNGAGISHHTTYMEQGSPTTSIYTFPQGYSEPPVHQLLSSYLRSCIITHSLSSYSCTFVFAPLDFGGQTGGQGDVILRQLVPAKEPGTDLGHTLAGQWQARVSLLALSLQLQQYIDDTPWPLHNLCSVSKFTYDQLAVSFGNHQLYVNATPTGLSLSFSPECPHSLVTESLEAFLRETQSLPLLLQGVYYTAKPMDALVEYVRRVPSVALSALAPSQIRLEYDHNFCLSLSLQANSSIAFTDFVYVKTAAPQQNPLHFFQAFLHSILSGVSADSEESSDKASLNSGSTAKKNTLFPAPSPISFPGRTTWPDSVPSPHGFSIPSIPPFPSPAVGSGVPRGTSWNCPLTLDQFNQLLCATPSEAIKPDSCVVGCSLLESFFGSVSLLFHTLQLVIKHQLFFMQSDHGVSTYRTDNLVITMAIEVALFKISLKSLRENVWSNEELEALVELFKKDIMCPPFSIQEMHSFVTLLVLPLPVLKSCVQLIHEQQKSSSNLTWNFGLCLTIPPGADLMGTPFTKGGPAVIYGRGKLLLFLRLERVQDRKSFILPIMYDPKTNVTYVARFQNQYRSSLHPFIDSILKKASTEFSSGQLQGHPSSSLFHAVLTLARTTFPA